ncbi:MAG: CDP-glycerol glycerophosphotransferase family protein [Balneola sp.]
MKLLFVAYGGGHMKLLHQIAKELILKPGIEIKIIALTTAYLDVKEFYNSEILKRPMDYKMLFEDELEYIKLYGEKLLAENHNSSSGLSEENSLFYLGMSFYDLVVKYGEDEAFRIYNEKKRHAFLPVRSMKRIIDDEAPDLVITTTSPKCELASLLASKDLGIPTMQIIDLFGDNFPIPFADHIVVLNEAVKQKLESRVGENSKVHALGQPVFDYTISMVEKVDRGTIRNKLSIRSETPVILFSPSRYLIYNEDKSVARELDHSSVNEPVFNIFKRLRQKYDFRVIVRPHPNDKADKFSDYIDGEDFIKLYKDKELSLYEAISVSDLVVAFNSTIMIESTLCEKVAFPFNYDCDQKYLWPELKEKPFVYSRDFKQLEENLSNILQSKGFENKIDGFYNRGAVAKIIELFNNI